MTAPIDLDELERLLAAATPGEWVTGCGFERNYLYGGGAHLACIGGSEDYEINDDGSPNEADNNAALIVAARNSFPALLTEIRELRAENARLKEDVRRQTSLAQDHFRNATRLAARAALGEPQ